MTATITVTEAIQRFGVEIDPHLERSISIPVLGGLQRQGDLFVIPAAMAGQDVPSATGELPLNGVAVISSENGGNTHLLLNSPGVTYDTVNGFATKFDVGVMTVAEGATAYLAHPEHGYVGIAPGTYLMRRQCEKREEYVAVAD